MVGMSVHGQPDSHIWSPEPLQAEQKEGLQGPHGGWLRLPSGFLPRHEVSFYVVALFSDEWH